LNGHAEPFAGIISGLPLLNFPMAARRALIEGAVARLAPGAPLVQFSYGLNAPVVPPDGHSVHCAALVWANVPPARVWVYRKI
jgi:phosphatidylethanolamine/phosphatidyl-N-methylethanolamine N-methyltransferase